MAEAIIYLVLVLGIPILGWAIGTQREKTHYRSIQLRESGLTSMPVINGKMARAVDGLEHKGMVNGHVVLSPDRFKDIVLAIRNFFGGRVSSYETLLDRARREAMIRLKQNAKRQGANALAQVRFETTNLGQANPRKKQVRAIEIMAYGTAVHLPRSTGS